MSLEEVRAFNSVLIKKQYKDVAIVFFYVMLGVMAILYICHQPIPVCLICGFGVWSCYGIFALGHPPGCISKETFFSTIIGEEKMKGKVFKNYWENDNDVMIELISNHSKTNIVVETYWIDAVNRTVLKYTVEEFKE